MLRSEKGFFLLELLLSLSAFLMLSLFLLPQLIFLRDQSRNAQNERESIQLLYEELCSKETGNTSFLNYSVDKGTKQFHVYWNELIPSGQKEVCVQVEENGQIGKKVCELFQQ